MNQVMSWICLLSICFLSLQVMIFLSLQVMIFICEDTFKLFNKVTLNNKKNNKKPANVSVTYDYKNKMAK